LPDATTEYPIAVTNAVSALRLAGVASPYRLLLSAPLYTAVAETTGHGYPIHEHIVRVLGEDGKSFGHLHRRGGDAELPRRRLRSHLGQDASMAICLTMLTASISTSRSRRPARRTARRLRSF
jgi:hypothetical protein